MIEAKFWTNPQFLLIVTEADAASEEDKHARLIISLMQKTSKETKVKLKLKQYIQFRIFQVNFDS
jgi:hypothetical protein